MKKCKFVNTGTELRIEPMQHRMLVMRAFVCDECGKRDYYGQNFIYSTKDYFIKNWCGSGDDSDQYERLKHDPNLRWL